MKLPKQIERTTTDNIEKTMQTQTPKSTRTAIDMLPAYANKLNVGSKLSLCLLLIVVGLSMILAASAQDYKLISREKQSEIRADYQTKRSVVINIKANKDDVASENQPAWDWVTRNRPTTDTHIRAYGQIHSVHADAPNPYACVLILKSDNTPYLTIIPQNICTDEGWASILKATPRPDFVVKWGYKIPEKLGEVTIAGSGTPIEVPKSEATAPIVIQPTMPVERTITDTKGRALEGTILAKTDTSISFQRKGTNGVIDINLNMLTANDQAFIATLIDKKTVKPTVLFLVNQDYGETEEVRSWLTKSGFDVKIGVITAGGYGPKSYKIPNEVSFITIDPVEVIDQFDVLWINQFNTNEPKGKEEFSHFSIAGRRNQQEKLVVIPTHSKLDKRDRFLSSDKYYAGNPKLGSEEKAYMTTDKTFIFCSDKPPHNTDGEMRAKLLAAIQEKL